MRRQRGGVVRGIGHHGQDLACAWVERDHAAGEAPQGPRRDPLEPRVDRGDHRGSALGAPQDLVHQVLGQELGGPARQEVVVLLLQAAPAVHERVEAGDLAAQPVLGVHADVLQPPFRRAAPGEHRPLVAGQDVAPVDVVFVQQQPLVGGVVGQLLRGEHLQIGQLPQQQHEQDQEGHGQPSDLAVHQPSPSFGATTVVASEDPAGAAARRARPRWRPGPARAAVTDDTLTSRASRTKFATRLDPP